MAIFSRRSLQQMIDSNTQLLTKDQVEKHVSALNRANEQSLDFEWEVAILYGLSKLGTSITSLILETRRSWILSLILTD
jgi:hypothetical protein